MSRIVSAQIPITSPSGFEYPEMSYTISEWKSITLKEQDIESYFNTCRVQSPLLFTALDTIYPSEDDLEVTEVTFQWGVVKINRGQWYDESFLESKIWRLKTGNGVVDSLSNGIDDYSGEIPGFLTAFVVLKGIIITYESPKEEEEQRNIDEYLRSGRYMNFGPLLIGGSNFTKVNNQYKVSGFSGSTLFYKNVGNNFQLNTSGNIDNPKPTKPSPTTSTPINTNTTKVVTVNTGPASTVLNPNITILH
ncbi:MAG: hypothetical protein HC892_16535 [Saprospiraceae bacterium]|nr:hypothetical protein [Saprospiraceae bacterium]